MRADTPWTEPRVARLKQLRRDGLSSSLIAADLGEEFTRNSVIGKLNRLGLSDCKRPVHSMPRQRRGSGGYRADVVARAMTRTPKPPQLPSPTKKPVSKRLTLAELNSAMCRYIEEDSPPWTYCAHPVVPGTNWCSYHFGVVYKT